MADAAQKFEDWATRLSKRKRHYETIFIISPAVDAAKVDEIAAKLDRVATELGTEFLRKDHWGKMRMAYEIEKHQTGNYFYYRYISNKESVKAIERALKLDASILRFQTVRLSDDLSDDEVQSLIERAPKEESTPPNARSEDDSGDYHSMRH